MALTKTKSGVTDPTALNVITSLTAGSANPTNDDLVAIYENGTSATKKYTIEELFRGITGLAALSAGPAAADSIAVHDASGNVSRKITITELFAGINNLTEDTSPALANDFVAAYDASGTTSKKVKLNNIGVFSQAYTSSDQTITAAGSLTLAHGFGTTPTLIQCRLKCSSAQFNYSENDEVVTEVYDHAGSNRGVSVVLNSSNILVRFGSASNTFQVRDKTTGAAGSITNGNWKLIVKAWA